MKKKGFTLIELLAVIVVLAIIALIATPIVMDVIKDSQKSAAERSAEMYLRAVENAIMTARLENGIVADGIYDVIEDGNLDLGGGKKLPVEVNGDIPKAGSKVAIKKEAVVTAGTNLTIGDYIVTIDDKGKATAIENGTTSIICKAVTPTEQSVWDTTFQNIHEMVVGIQATESSPYAAGAEYSCDLGDGARTFYVLKEDGNNVKLLMNESIGEAVAWCADESLNACEGDGAKAYLETQTSGWVKLTSVGGKVNLPEAQDIADAMDDTDWSATDSIVTGKVGPVWMRANFTPEFYGYWTSTPLVGGMGNAWFMNAFGYLYDSGAEMYGDIQFTGVRPVITIPKANMSL